MYVLIFLIPPFYQHSCSTYKQMYLVSPDPATCTSTFPPGLLLRDTLNVLVYYLLYPSASYSCTPQGEKKKPNFLPHFIPYCKEAQSLLFWELARQVWPFEMMQIDQAESETLPPPNWDTKQTSCSSQSKKEGKKIECIEHYREPQFPFAASSLQFQRCIQQRHESKCIFTALFITQNST